MGVAEVGKQLVDEIRRQLKELHVTWTLRLKGGNMNGQFHQIRWTFMRSIIDVFVMICDIYIYDYILQMDNWLVVSNIFPSYMG